MPHDNGPGVRFPPPLCFAVPWGIGFVLHRRWPLPLLPDALVPIAQLAGVALGSVGLIGLSWAISRFVMARTTVLPHRPATAFVVSGPYRLTRNPMYLSMASLHLGTSLVVGSLWLALGVPLGMRLVGRFVIRREEAYLATRFGAAYAQYMRRVRRWI